MSRTRGALLILLVPVLALAVFLVYTLSFPRAPWVLPWLTPTLASLLVSSALQGLLVAVMCAGIFALPIAWLYGRHALLAGMLCAAPVAWFLLDVAFARATRSAHLVVPIVNAAFVLAAMFVAVRVAQRWIARRRGTRAPAAVT